ncbi:MAG: electron transport complex subunit RsxC [gamma proteobacterium symbiont of Bathyaustriella thionipta]|nr:electron transport complex subunit RsxC [gamma proteobacterium symbiont of Bathyaustriella thionipta]
MSFSNNLHHPQRLWHFHGGLHLEECKALSNGTEIRPMPAPEKLYIPLAQHIGGPAEAMVSIGETVLSGQKIGRAQGYISAPVHASSSGRVIDIGDYPVPHPSGLSAPCIVIQTDGEDRWPQPPASENYSSLQSGELRERIREAGIAGLGGALFPTSVKLNAGPEHKISTLIINAVECEPYISSDDRLMREQSADIINGIRILMHMLKPERCLLAIEDNKPQALDIMRQAVSESGLKQCLVCKIPTLYPSGGEKQLIRILTGKEVPWNGLPANIGILVQNVATVAAIAQAILQHRPLLSRIVTLTGQGIAKPGNYEVRIGTPLSDLIAFAGGYQQPPERLIMGGPMMGFTLHNDAVPITKGSNCIIATGRDELPEAVDALACTRCGQCERVCPAQLLPQQLYWYARARDMDKIQDYNLFDCIECGCCAHVCPSHIPLVQYYRFAKNEIWAKEEDKRKSDRARERHQAREARLARLEQQRKSRLRRKKEALNKKPGNKTADPKKTAIEAAMKRVAEKKKNRPATAANTQNLSADQEKQIQQANARRQATTEDPPA